MAEEVEYESDPEEAKRLLTTRRREASDDEDEREGDERERVSRAGTGSDGESDGHGAPAEYDDDEELEVEEEEELGEYEEEVGIEREYELREGGDGVEVKELDGEREGSVGELSEIRGVDQVGEEKKVNEPFAVPTAGAFYMHDDRFRDNARGRHRRTFGGRKLWETKDEWKWGHDKFEEMTIQERHYERGTSNSRGQYRGRGQSQGADRGYKGNKSKAYNHNNQNHGPKSVRGRGPRRYEPSNKNNSEAPPTQHKHIHRTEKSIEKTLHATSGRTPKTTSNLESDPLTARKQVSASSLSFASPPFYPSGSSNKELTLPQKREVLGGTTNRNENLSMSRSNATMRGKNAVDSIDMENLYINNSILPIGGKPSTSLQLPPPGSSFVNNNQPLQPRAQGRGLAPSGQMNFQPGAPLNQVSTASTPTQLHTVRRDPVQSRVQSSSQAALQQLGQRPGSGSQTSSPPKTALSINSFEPGDLESPQESIKCKTSLVGKGKGSVQGGGKGSFLYGGAQIIGASGNMGSGHGDQNFAATPAFLPVMPFGGQHPGGIGVPAVGMAFPGYVAQPQLGLGNSEMTWLPVLAGAAGALGATYCSPYIAVDGAYQPRPSGKTPSLGDSTKENNTNKPNNELKPSQRPEVSSDKFGQRQKNIRRYTEMNFD
ncbi:protein MLN51 homolog isoform X1 [Actinidia eriantha]|uniref:protein MLN51 homolog isoform X1 n=1 Tax=Actinidia eriantha TaxID=165200 RepID=UPI002588671E|nr:protein MLN51 homolog isoform X1 [Actinidia eriantha]XP_057466403.1 protein MLN51 homolog isoform X1 [Actinidia eriantha]